jgi:hypothetical protein
MMLFVYLQLLPFPLVTGSSDHSVLLAASFFDRSGRQFLQKYGHHYNLFSNFYWQRTEKNESKLSGNHNPSMSTVVDISKTYLVRNYSKYVDFEYISRCDENKYLHHSSNYTDIDKAGV